MRSAPRPHAVDPGLAAKVAFLARPASYPEPTSRVDTVETHMSWVFLTDRHAWKLKKPVRQSYLDFSTAAARRFCCDEELRLNRRLTHGVYLDVVALAVDPSGKLRLGPGGAAVDWLVRMRRLPADRMLDQLIRAGAARAEDIRAVMDVLCRFYRRCEPVSLSASEYRGRFAAGIADNLRELSAPEYALPCAAIEAACLRQREFVEHAGALLDSRARERRIVEAHGDLRPEHVCVQDPPQVIDCLEFARDFRILDPADELAFLALECERLGAPWMRQPILDACAEQCGDAPPDALVHFYQSYRACMRAKIAIWHLKEPDLPDPGKWTALALDYLRLAAAHIARA